MSDARDNGITELVTDHREVEEMFARFDKSVPGSKERKRIADEFTIELVRHSVAEEEHLYPAVRRHVPGGDALADREIKDHAEVEKILKRIEQLPPDAETFDELVATLQAEVSEHVRDEENNLFPCLRESCNDQELLDLGDKIRSAKKTAPTRPHPHAPSTPPGNKLLAPGTGLVDRVRDHLTGRGR
ncbi:hemerythrin domain-containing protein [Streptomyces sp. VRA16 Mangrove soil]|uniref:hemerythrin domain-containing protein n=1 Tax=Streptomyces sp. VRA16 Mangrove soil TaxID=2817434 RepID=UPI001A9D10F8|nr:hemerythrin domain-containing protein [Streptomyces sp. VRA16 Mangrove soil]MBO1335695.1 hemerythrin domain-containing protein [Streptomyces sp. VRA16 Mangrove soil]